ncbi:AI-2E family transporter, partial [Paeniglutamicibacter antarcticus]
MSSARNGSRTGPTNLSPRRSGERYAKSAKEITASVGIHLSGMAILAAMNATPTFILLTVLQVQLVAVLTVLAPPITTIPLVGSVISMGIVMIVSLFHSPRYLLTSPLNGLIEEELGLLACRSRHDSLPLFFHDP